MPTKIDTTLGNLNLGLGKAFKEIYDNASSDDKIRLDAFKDKLKEYLRKYEEELKKFSEDNASYSNAKFIKATQNSDVIGKALEDMFETNRVYYSEKIKLLNAEIQKNQQIIDEFPARSQKFKEATLTFSKEVKFLLSEYQPILQREDNYYNSLDLFVDPFISVVNSGMLKGFYHQSKSQVQIGGILSILEKIGNDLLEGKTPDCENVYNIEM
jgi:hypothetical protein